MKKLLSALLVICTLQDISMSFLKAETQEYINLATFNIYKRTEDGDEHAWSTRQELIKNVIRDYDFDMLGTQESDRTQVNSILTLGGYMDFGIGINTGIQASGWRNAIIYKSNRFTVVDSGAFWLSERPDTVSAGWDGAQNRNCSWTRIHDGNTGKYFYYFCAHFDHLGTLARINSAKMICDTLPKIAGDYPAFFMGDLNAIETSEPIQILNEGLHDSRALSLTPPQGPYGTGHGWRIDVNVRRIDYIYTYNGNGRDRIEVQEYEVIDKTYDGKSPSDHWPVRIKARLVPGVATLRVTSGLDDGGANTLRSVLAQALPGDSIFIDRQLVDTIRLNSPINIHNNIRLDGNGATVQVAAPGISGYRLFSLGNSTSETTDSISLYNLRLSGGDISGSGSSGGIFYINKNVDVKMKNMEFRNGKATYGGAIFCSDTTGVHVSMENCLFSGNSSDNNAGAVYLKAISANLSACIFENNTTGRNGSALVSNKNARVNDCIFRNNRSDTSTATDYGAAVFNTGGGTMQLINCTFDSNTTTHYGTGAFACSGPSTTTTFINNTFSGNEGILSSAIYNRAGNIKLIHCTVAGNRTLSPGGAAIDAYPSEEAGINLTNSIAAFNYNTSGKADISAGENASVTGTRNITGTTNGALSLNDPIAFTYEKEIQGKLSLFKAYADLPFNGSQIRLPLMADNGGLTPTIAIDAAGIAYRSGIVQEDLPRYDQRNYTRYTTPCAGAFEVICDFPEQLSVTEIQSTSALLSWQGNTGHYQISYQSEKSSEKSSEKNIRETMDNSLRLTDLSPSTSYSWKIRSVCDPDFPGEWLSGAAFTTPFRLLVTSGKDDGAPETLRYIVANAQAGDSIVIAVDTITLGGAVDLNKSIRINGQGVVIRPEDPAAGHRIFTLGADLTTPDTIRLYDMELQGGDLTENSSTAGNGGIMFLYKYTNLTVSDVIFKSGKAIYGGAIHCNDSTGTRINMRDCTFTGNEAQNNAGAFYVKGMCRLENCLFENNKTNSNGSAITTIKALYISNSTFSNNIAAGSGAYGGAVFNTSGGLLLIENSTFEGNEARTSGSGAFGCSTGGTTSYFVNCTFHGNSGVTASVFYNRAGTINLAYCTVAGNNAINGTAPAYLNYNASNVTANFVNNIFAYNYNTAAAYDIGIEAASIANGSNNVIAVIDRQQNIVNTIDFSYGSVAGNDPALFAAYNTGIHQIPVLKFNGGTTRTIALSGTDSKACGVGITAFENMQMPLSDQRGIERDVPPCAGAFELTPDTGLNDPGTTRITVYPNPASNYINIQTTEKLMQVQLLDMTGTEIRIFTGKQCLLDGIASGSYLLKIRTDQGIKTKKIIIQ